MRVIADPAQSRQGPPVLSAAKWGSMLHQVFQNLPPPPEDAGIRVCELEVGPVSACGAGRTRFNPSANVEELPWPLSPNQADYLSACGVPLSLARVLVEVSLPQSAVEVSIAYLHELVAQSEGARDVLNMNKRLLASVAQHQSHGSNKKVIEIVRLCKESLANTQDWQGNESLGWTRATGSYEVWLRCPKSGLMQVRVNGMKMGLSAFDLNGVHLTGGRLWAGSMVLGRWAVSLVDAGVYDKKLPALEIGAGTGFAGIAVAKAGVRTVLSDREPALLSLLRDNVSANGVDEQCRVLDLDWGALQQPGKMRRLLAKQRFGMVIGADVVYEGEAHAKLVAGVVRYALPHGGIALLTNARRHRRGTDQLTASLRGLGLEVQELTIPVAGALQDFVCGDFEPDQEYAAFMVTVPPLEREDCEN